MRIKLSFLAVGLSLLLLSAAALGASPLTLQESDLLAYSNPYEVNASPPGGVYVSDLGADAIWDVAPSGIYTRHNLSSDVVDARADTHGDIWWTDGLDGFGRLYQATGTATRWAMGGGQNLGGLAFDQGGRVWLTQYFGREVFGFDPTSTELCTYAVGAPSFYVLTDGGQVWLANYSEDRIYRLDPDQGEATSWQIPGSNPIPVGLALADDATVWWADSGEGNVARLEPALDQVTTYSLPLGTDPQMVALDSGMVWYTEDGQGTVGTLDPSGATGVAQAVTSATVSLSPDCRVLGPGSAASVAAETGSFDWTDDTLTPTVDQGGWTVYVLPSGSQPYGIAESSGYVWLADRGRTKLARLEPATVEVPGVDLEKLTNGHDADVPPGPTIAVGDSIVWTYVVTNSGDVELTDLSVTDDNGTPDDGSDDFTCAIGALSPGAADDTTCSQTGAALEGQYANIATAEGFAGTTPVTDTDASHYLGAPAIVELSKLTNGHDADAPPGPSIAGGDPVTWTYVVTNIGSVELTNVSVTDDNGTPDDGSDDFTCAIGALSPGVSDDTTCSQTSTALNGQYANTAIAEGLAGTTPVTDTDASHYFGTRAAIDLEKLTNGHDADAAPGPSISGGDPVTWTYAVTNIGNVELTDVNVTDDNGTPDDGSDDFICAIGTLSPGAADDSTCSQTGSAAEGQYANIATAEGFVGTTPVTDTDASHYVGVSGESQIFLPSIMRQ